MNALYVLLQLYPDKEWDWRELSSHENISWELVKNYLNKCWHWNYLSCNLSIPLSVIFETFTEYRWSVYYISKRADVTIDVVKQHPKFRWDWNMLSQNKNMTWDIVKQYPKYPWSIHNFSANPNLTMEILSENKHLSWSWSMMYMNLNITIDYIIQEIGIEKILQSTYTRDISFLGSRSDITSELVLSYPKVRWQWHNMCNSLPDILDFVKKEPHDEHIVFCASMSKFITWKDIQDNPDIKWYPSAVSGNPNITLDIIKANPDYKWNWYNISRRIPLSIIESNPDCPWDINGISGNPTLNLRKVLREPTRDWHYVYLSENRFQYFPWKVYKAYWKWRKVVKRNRAERAQNKIIYDLILHQYKLVLRDIDVKFRPIKC